MTDQFDPVQQLRRQLGMIERSCQLYDEGHIDEGVRIAASIRTLFRDTFRSGKPLTLSVLTHLQNAGHQGLRFLSTCRKMAPNTLWAGSGLSMSMLHIENGKHTVARNEPKLNRFSSDNWWALRDDWWNQVVYVMAAGPVTRRDLVLTAAEQDGGVHVDSEVDETYAKIRAGLWTAGGPDGKRIPDGNLSDLRQMGYELLMSRDLTRIAESRSVSGG